MRYKRRTIITTSKRSFYMLLELNCWPGSNSALLYWRSVNVLTLLINKLGAEMDHSLSRMVISSIFFIHHKCPIQNCWKWDKTWPTNDTSLYMATYLGWRTELCCHHGLPETSLPLSGTSETVKHNTNKQSHISTRCILHVKTTEMYLHRVSTSVFNVNAY